MFDNLFTVENLLNVLGAFAYLFGELFLLFMILGVPVSVASRRALREGEDDRILGEALPL